MRQWWVVSALIERDDHLLLVANRRRNGSVDWSPPGGVVDEGEVALSALEREVSEETGLVVHRWSAPIYEIQVGFVAAQMDLRVEVFAAQAWAGTLNIEDPDGIVHDGGFYPIEACRERLASSPRWVSDPVVEWLDGRWQGTKRFEFRVEGRLDEGLTVNRLV